MGTAWIRGHLLTCVSVMGNKHGGSAVFLVALQKHLHALFLLLYYGNILIFSIIVAHLIFFFPLVKLFQSWEGMNPFK